MEVQSLTGGQFVTQLWHNKMRAWTTALRKEVSFALSITIRYGNCDFYCLNQDYDPHGCCAGLDQCAEQGFKCTGRPNGCVGSGSSLEATDCDSQVGIRLPQMSRPPTRIAYSIFPIIWFSFIRSYPVLSAFRSPDERHSRLVPSKLRCINHWQHWITDTSRIWQSDCTWKQYNCSNCTWDPTCR